MDLLHTAVTVDMLAYYPAVIHDVAQSDLNHPRHLPGKCMDVLHF